MQNPAIALQLQQSGEYLAMFEASIRATLQCKPIDGATRMLLVGILDAMPALFDDLHDAQSFHEEP